MHRIKTAEQKGQGMTSQRARDRMGHQLSQRGIKNNQVLEVMRGTPRHLFVDEALASRAYENNALPIGFGQTISQPYIVARMTEALVDSGVVDKVLEIGTGCGYQTMILAQLARRVFSIERVEPLALRARERLRRLKISNVQIRHDDGTEGWLAHAPYDAIIVAAAPLGIPQALMEQMAVGGRLVIPVGEPNEQRLLLIKRTDAAYEEENLDWVKFVPMIQGIG